MGSCDECGDGKDVTFSWDNADNVILPVVSDNSKYIKYLDVGESASVDFQVIADTRAAAGLYKLNLHLSYFDPVNNVAKTLTTSAGVYVGGGTDFDVAFSDNANGQLSFTVANIGSNPAASVSVVIPPQRAWRVNGPNTVIIGNLNTGDYTVASYKLSSATSQNQTGGSGAGATGSGGTGTGRAFNMTGGSNPSIITVQIAYTNTLGLRETVQKEVNIGFQNLGTGTTSTFASGGRRTTAQPSFFVTHRLYLIGGVVIIVAGFVFLRRRRRSV